MFQIIIKKYSLIKKCIIKFYMCYNYILLIFWKITFLDINK